MRLEWQLGADNIGIITKLGQMSNPLEVVCRESYGERGSKRRTKSAVRVVRKGKKEGMKKGVTVKRGPGKGYD